MEEHSTQGGPPAPGWWMATDGRWYPPDAGESEVGEPTPAEAQGSSGWRELIRKPAVLVGAGAAALVLVVIVAIVATSGGDGDGGDEATDSALDDAPESIVGLITDDLPPLDSLLEDLEDGFEPPSSTVEPPPPPPPPPAVEPEPTSTPRPTPTPTPAVTTVEPGFGFATPEQVGVALDGLDDAALVGVDYRLTVEAAALVDAVDQANDSLGPAPGEVFLVARYNLEVFQGRRPPAGSVDVDGVKRTVDLPVGPNTLVVAVDADADQVGLNVTDQSSNQTVSVLTGERAPGHPEVLYRRDRRIAVNESRTLDYVFTHPNPDHCGSGGQGAIQLTLGGAELVWSGVDSPLLQAAGLADRLLAPTEADQAWLIVAVNDYRATGPVDLCRYSPAIPAERIVLVADDGSETSNSGPLAQTTRFLVFPAAADTTQATVEIRPADGVLAEQVPGSLFAFGDGTMEFPVRFSTDVEPSGDGTGS